MSVDAVIVGADGAIGRALKDTAHAAGLSVIGTTRRREAAEAPDRLFLDLSTLEGLEPAPRARLVVLVGAMSSIHGCAVDPERSEQVNVLAPQAVAERIAGRDGLVVHLSSMAVYDGQSPAMGEDDPVSPSTTYGAQKARAEVALQSAFGTRCLSVRPSKVIPPDFPLWCGWIASLGRGEAITPFHDVQVAPITLARFVEALWAVVAPAMEAGAFGAARLNLTARDQESYLALAERLCDAVGGARALIQPVARGERGVEAEVYAPRFACTSGRRLMQLTGLTAPRAAETMAEFLASHDLSAAHGR